MIVKKFNDIPLEYGYRISHKVIEDKYKNGKSSKFYVMNLMKGTHPVNYWECKISEDKENEVDT